MQRAVAALLWQLPPQLLAVPLPAVNSKLPLPIDLVDAAARALSRQGTNCNTPQQQQQQVSPPSGGKRTSSSRQSLGQQQQQQQQQGQSGDISNDIKGKPSWQVTAELLLQLLQLQAQLAPKDAAAAPKQAATAEQQSSDALAVLAAAAAAAEAAEGAAAAEAAGAPGAVLQQQLLTNLVQCFAGEAFCLLHRVLL
jgi:hypothetical protein